MSDKKKYIKIKGANEHNLKNIDIEIPRDEFTVVTGLSGSGKSSLAFDTIYAEGQRRYMESLSSYARQFLGQMEKPQVESIEGLPPAISIDQKSTNRNPRSTVGTVTEIYDYMRLLYARAGVPHCPKCGKEIKKQSVDEIVDRVLELPERTKFQILAPIVRGKKYNRIKFTILSVAAALLIDFLGMLWLTFIGGHSIKYSFTYGFVPFLPLDLIKAVVVAQIVPLFRRVIAEQSE